MSDPVWVFFAAQATPSSIRRVLPDRISKTQPVVIVDEPVSVVRRRSIPAFNLRWKRHTEKDLTFYRPLHLPVAVPGIGRVTRVLNQLLLRREIDRLLPPGRRRIVCYDSPTQDYLVKRLGEERSIYLAIDDLTITVTGESIKGELDAERQLLSKVHLVICISDVLAERLRERSPSFEKPTIRVLPNGYDERIFDSNGNYPEPNVLRRIPRPRILVAGHISERIDWDGIIGASQLRTPWTWIFVGPADNGMKERIASRLGQHGFYHPPIALQDVPGWIQHCDACAVPYRLNSFTRASSPLKAIEYLAMGAPVLSTPIPSLECYKNVLNWVREANGVSYANVLDKILIEGCESKAVRARRASVEHDSWGNRVDQFRDFVFNGDASKLQVK